MMSATEDRRRPASPITFLRTKNLLAPQAEQRSLSYETYVRRPLSDKDLTFITILESYIGVSAWVLRCNTSSTLKSGSAIHLAGEEDICS